MPCNLLILVIFVVVLSVGDRGVWAASTTATVASSLGNVATSTTFLLSSSSTSTTSASSSSLSSSSTSIYDDAEEQTFVAIKPDAVQRNLVGEIIKRFECKGLKVIGMKMIRPQEKIIMEHYSEHKHQPFFRDLVDFFSSGPIVAMVIEGKNAIHITRKLIGKTQPEDAEPGTIRGDFCFGKGRNLVHSSDSIDNAIREINLWFQSDELIRYSKTIDGWVKLMPPPVV